MAIKVLHVLSVEKPAFYFTNLIAFTDKARVEHVFANFASDTEFAGTIRERGTRILELGPLTKQSFVGSALRLQRILKAERPDIVHTHLFDPTFIGLWLAKRAGLPTVVTRHHSDAVHKISSPVKRKFYLSLEAQNNKRADHIIAPSRMVRECVVEWEGTPATKVSLIPYPQTSSRFDAITPEIIEGKRTEIGMDSELSLVCVSRLVDRKGHRYLFEAIAPLIREGLKAKLYLIGTGDFESSLRSLADDLGLSDHIEFLGWRDDALAIMGAADIVVHPSLEDALSQSLIESLMLERPIIATDISGASDTLGDGKYGRLVPPEDAEAIRAALVEMIADLDNARVRAKSGRVHLLEYMDAGRVVAEYMNIYESLLQPKT